MNDFYRISGLDSVIGAIDGTLIEINKPCKYGDYYICQKGYPAMFLGNYFPKLPLSTMSF